MADQKKKQRRFGLWFRVLEEKGFPRPETDRFCDEALAAASFGTANQEGVLTCLGQVSASGLASASLALSLVTLVAHQQPKNLCDAGYTLLCRVSAHFMTHGCADTRSVLSDGDAFLRPLAQGAPVRRSSRVGALMWFCTHARLEDVFVRDGSALADAAVLRVLWDLPRCSDESSEALRFLQTLAHDAVWRAYLLPWAAELARRALNESVCAFLQMMIRGPNVAFVVHLERKEQLAYLVYSLHQSRGAEAQRCLSALRAAWPQRIAEILHEKPAAGLPGVCGHVCPISLHKCVNPARASDGFVYERDHIMTVMAASGAPCSPMTRAPLLPILIPVCEGNA